MMLEAVADNKLENVYSDEDDLNAIFETLGT